MKKMNSLYGKKIGAAVAGMTLLVSSLGFTLNAFGATNVEAQLTPELTVVVDGVTQKFTDANGNVVYPIIYNGSAYLPIRSVGELMGKNVSWNGETDTINLSGKSLATDTGSFNSSGLITVEDAKSKALSHAGLSSDQANFVKAKLDWDDGRQIYEIEFYTGDYKEYDYEIDARTGEIISYDFDAEGFNNTAQKNTGSYIGETKAKSIALGAVPGAGDNNVVKVKFDYDDGRAEYEVKIIYNSMEHEFDIDAVTGSILPRDSESVYH